MNDRSPTYTRFWAPRPEEVGGNASQRLAAIFVPLFYKNGQRTWGSISALKENFSRYISAKIWL